MTTGECAGCALPTGATHCELVVMAAGIVPNAELARDAGIACKRGVTVDDLLRTSDSDIFAVGECAEHRGICYGLVQPLYEQGRVLAAHLADRPTAPYPGSVVSTKLKVSGVDVFSAGDFADDDACEVARTEDSRAGIYRKLVLRDGRAVGAVLVGDLAPAAELDRLVRARAEVASPGAVLVGAAAEVAAAPPVLALADEAIVCACNGVAKGTILSAVRGRGSRRARRWPAAPARRAPAAAAGRRSTRSFEWSTATAPKRGRRSGRSASARRFPREEVISAIRERHLTSVKEVLFALGWTTEGCSSCRPAINYYLTMCWPGENVDDPRSRLGQRAGPRQHPARRHLFGGAADVRRGDHARGADSHRRGGQAVRDPDGEADRRSANRSARRKKEDLPSVWEALELPSGFAYAKAIRTVKTCVGSTWCRFGTRDAMGFGARLEKTFENLWTPAKVKMAVNACPRNCAESLIKDVGLIAGDTVWEIYVGGNGGVKVRQAERLGTAHTDEEALELIGAFLQLYREEARYGARTSEFVAEVGIDALRARLVEDTENRRALGGPDGARARRANRSLAGADRQAARRRRGDAPRVRAAQAAAQGGGVTAPAPSLAPRWVRVCARSEIPEGGGRLCTVGAIEVGVFRTSHGAILALVNRCPHKGGPLSEGIVTDHVVVCPLHGWKVDLVTGEAAAPDAGCVTRFPVDVRGEDVYLDASTLPRERSPLCDVTGVHPDSGRPRLGRRRALPGDFAIMDFDRALPPVLAGRAAEPRQRGHARAPDHPRGAAARHAHRRGIARAPSGGARPFRTSPA